MSWVVDTCVIIDVLRGDDEFAQGSARALEAKRAEGLIIAPMTYIELAPSFNGDHEEQDKALRKLGITCEFGDSFDALHTAYDSWYAHILRRRAGSSPKRPIADLVIGAYALTRYGLITRNESDFRAFYPSLTIYNPTTL